MSDSQDVPDFLERTRRLFGSEALAVLRTRKIAVAGCGGVGGAASLLLTRLGVERFHLADPGRFDPPDLNRQWGASRATLGRNKAAVHAELVRSIQPSAQVRIFSEGVTDLNVEPFLEGCDLLIDSLDLSVPGPLRMRLYERAHALRMPSISAPIVGLGTVVAVSVPPGPPLAAFGEVIAGVLGTARLPQRLYQLFPPAHLDALVRGLPEHRAPSNSAVVALASSVTCTEAVMALTGPAFAGWRPPVALPQLLVIDLAGPTLAVIELSELRRAAGPSPRHLPDEVGRKRREAVLEAVGHNLHHVPADLIKLDLLTDSWAERAEPPPASRGFAIRPEDVLKPLYGFEHVVPVFKGRFAEALLTRVALQPGSAVATNALFPTALFHLTAAGIRPVHVGVDDGTRGVGGPFRGDIDLAALEQAFSQAPVKAVYVEMCSNGVGGQPVSMANLRAVQALARQKGALVIVDAARAFENAALIRACEESFDGRPLAALVRDLCSLADVCTASLTKDFPSVSGAFIGVRSPELAAALTDLAVLGFGDGLPPPARLDLARALLHDHEGPLGASGRVATVEALWKALDRLGVPLIGPPGGHAVFVDAKKLLGLLPAGAAPAATLCAALYATAGVRAGIHLATPEQQQAQVHWVRLALPLGVDTAPWVDPVAEAFVQVLAGKAGLRPLKPGPILAPGRLGEMGRPFVRI